MWVSIAVSAFFTLVLLAGLWFGFTGAQNFTFDAKPPALESE